MFDIKPDSRMTLTERLLYNIWQELSNNKKSEKKEIKKSKKKIDKICPYCNKVHNKGYEYANCARRNKKAG